MELLLISTDVVEWTHFLTSIGISQAWPAYSCLQWLFLILLQFSLLAIRAMTTIIYRVSDESSFYYTTIQCSHLKQCCEIVYVLLLQM